MEIAILTRTGGEDKTKRNDGAHDVACDHDALAVEAVEQYSGERTDCDGWNRTRQHDKRDHQARMGEPHGEIQDGDVVEVVADLADDLARPGIPVITVLVEQLQKIAH